VQTYNPLFLNKANDRVSGNIILDLLEPKHLARVEQLGKMEALGTGAPIYAYDGQLSTVYFPVDCVFSILMATERGDRAEAGTVGREGIMGVEALFGTPVSSHPVIVQVPGKCLAMPRGNFLQLAEDEGVRELCLRYVGYSLAAAHIDIGCSRIHGLEQRMCRWLLTAQFRAGRARFPLTQELLAEMLGTARQSVSAIASSLQRDQLLTYSRGTVQLLDTEKLEARACECYAQDTKLYRRFLRTSI
jgi:CRP-like cAMP-binding protein